MIEFTTEQFDAYYLSNPAAFRAALADVLFGASNTYGEIGEVLRRSFADVVLETAALYGLEDVESIARFGFLMTEQTPRFHEHPVFNDILNRDDLSASAKIDAVLADDTKEAWQGVEVTLMHNLAYAVGYWWDSFQRFAIGGQGDLASTRRDEDQGLIERLAKQRAEPSGAKEENLVARLRGGARHAATCIMAPYCRSLISKEGME